MSLFSDSRAPSLKRSALFSPAPSPSPEKDAFRARLTGAPDLFAPLEPFGDRSALEMMVWGITGGDLGDGPFAYEPRDGIADLVRVFPTALRRAQTAAQMAKLAAAMQALTTALEAKTAALRADEIPG